MPQRQIAGKTVNIEAPYAEGHTLNEAEAGALNQTFFENIGNNLRKKIEEAAAEGKTDADIQAMVDEYASTFEFGNRGGGRILDPVEREARDIATESVKAAIRRKGMTITSIAKDRFDELVAKQAQKPEVRKEAERRVKEAKKVETIEISEEDLAPPAAAE